MTTSLVKGRSFRHWGNVAVLAGSSAAISLSIGCSALSVDSPDVTQPIDIESAAGASSVAIGAMTDFASAFGGATPTATAGTNHVTSSAQIADEFFATGLSVGTELDSRTVADPSSTSGAYNALHASRVNLLYAIDNFERIAPDSGARIGQLFALVGFTEIFLAETFCSGVPLSHLDPSFRPIYGEPLTNDEIYQHALTQFDSARKHAVDSTRIVQLAQLGQARTLLNLGRFAEAALAVATVPSNYTYSVAYVTGTLNNGVFGLGSQNFFTIPDREGTNGINWRTANDPRVRLVNRSPALKGVDGTTDIYAFVPYQASNSPIVLASGTEARLIEAEAALQGGNAASWLAIHNALRATVPGLSPLTDPSTQAGRVDLQFRERAFWLFLTGHRHGDMRRLVRQYARNAESVFPTGAYRDGLSYGNATNVAPPGTASNNPNYRGCLNRGA